MTEWNAGANSQEFYLYDATGNRILKRSITGTGTTLAVYSFGLEENDYSGTGVLTTQTHYYNLASHLIGSTTGATTTFYMTDALDSVLTAFGQSAIEGEQVYGPFGASSYQSGLINTAKGYTGQVHDGVSGLDYYVARYYDPVMGMFLSVDTVQGNQQGMNPYQYVGDNPESKNDPSGHDAVNAYYEAIVTGWYAILEGGMGIYEQAVIANALFSQSFPNMQAVADAARRFANLAGNGSYGVADILNANRGLVYDVKGGATAGEFINEASDVTIAGGGVQVAWYARMADKDPTWSKYGPWSPGDPAVNDPLLAKALGPTGMVSIPELSPNGTPVILSIFYAGHGIISFTARPYQRSRARDYSSAWNALAKLLGVSLLGLGGYLLNGLLLGGRDTGAGDGAADGSPNVGGDGSGFGGIELVK